MTKLKYWNPVQAKALTFHEVLRWVMFIDAILHQELNLSAEYQGT